jgi:16S rRNA (cytosine1402-N4)-methyltransferase
MPSQPEHVPVMLGRVLALLQPALDVPGAVFVDMTLGLAGHSIEFLRACPTARLVGLDRDPGALAIARTRLSEFGDRVELVHADNDRLPEVLAGLGIDRVHAVLFDLGVSSMQLDEDDRGFSYSRDVGLDMRMNPLQARTAATVLAEYSSAELTRILRVYGEERFAQRIATAIVARRKTSPLTTTGELAALVAGAVPAAARRKGSGHPAKKTFQAVRIEVNAELDVLTAALPAAIAALRVDGRIAVLSYHSLEDRITKQTLAASATTSVPDGVPVVPEQYQPSLKLLTRGAEKADAVEVAENPRARSARLRAAVRIKEAA